MSNPEEEDEAKTPPNVLTKSFFKARNSTIRREDQQSYSSSVGKTLDNYFNVVHVCVWIFHGYFWLILNVLYLL